MFCTLIKYHTGNRWKVSEWPERTNKSNFSVEFIALYQYDKSEAVDMVLAKDTPPNVVVLQECSVYFPGDIDTYQALLIGWIDQIIDNGSIPVVATVVPTTKTMGLIQDTKNWIKHRLLGRPTQVDQVRAYNDWIRTMASDKAIALLDLEALLRVSDTDRIMNQAYSSGDGIHPNAYAYSLFDQEFERLLHLIDLNY